MSILVMGATFLDIKGFPEDQYVPNGRNVGKIEYIHGGVARNVVEDIANVELRPTFLSLVDDTPMGDAIVEKLNNHKVNTDYMLTVPNGMGTWLAVFDNNGDVAGSISKRPDLMPIVGLLEEKGDEIFARSKAVDIFTAGFHAAGVVIGKDQETRFAEHLNLPHIGPVAVAHTVFKHHQFSGDGT